MPKLGKEREGWAHGHSSSFCYPIVVRETENRQHAPFFWPRQRNLWVTDVSNAGRKLGKLGTIWSLWLALPRLRLPHPSRFSKGGYHGRWYRGLADKILAFMRTPGGGDE